MKKLLLCICLSVLASFSTLTASYAMKRHPDRDDKKKSLVISQSKNLITEIDLIFREFPFFPREIEEKIVIENIHTPKILKSLTLVCTSWNEFISEHKFGDYLGGFLKDGLYPSELTDEDLQKYSYLVHLNLHERYEAVTNEGLTGLRNLVWLHLGDNEIITSNALKGLRNLVWLNLGENKIITGNALKKLKNLTHLDLNVSTGVTDDEIKKLTNLKHLNLHNILEEEDEDPKNNITDEGIQYLTSLEYLDLSYNRNFTDNGIWNLTNLECLDLSANNVITDEVISRLLNLKSLRLSYSNITNVGIRTLTNLNKLNIAYNSKIRDEGIEELTNLKKLNITDNSKITDKGIENLTNLISLKVSKDEECTLTSKGLKDLTNLTTLSLGGNLMIIPDNVIRNLTNLTELNTHGGMITENFSDFFLSNESYVAPEHQLSVSWENEKLFCKAYNKEKLEIQRPLYIEMSGGLPDYFNWLVEYAKSGSWGPGSWYGTIRFQIKLMQYTSFHGYTSNDPLTWSEGGKYLTKLKRRMGDLLDALSFRFIDKCRAYAGAYYYLAGEERNLFTKLQHCYLATYQLSQISNEFSHLLTVDDRNNQQIYHNTHQLCYQEILHNVDLTNFGPR